MGGRVLKGWWGSGRRVAPLGVFTAALWLCAGGLFTGSPAHAATAASQAGSGLCGGRLVRTLPFETGEVRVYKTRTQACALTVARVPGERRRMAVSIQPRGGAPVRDEGRFTRYAGPVTVGAINRCVYVKGGVGAGTVDSGWILC
ncbi:hypothetical protein OG625_25315 [Streptomyces sp. NBC_01351]|uniref:hypothetical protein n=1 Tax=Streptomyces sp. NBC_01351 TaxID=2903833 RepID=UPI002E35AB47|nr:hypothetical protein [Streptomyces sp. NBC_01351]